MTIRDVLMEASGQITRRDAEVLLADALPCDRAWLLAHAETALTSFTLDRFRALIARRAAHEPLQYITGHQEFYGLNLRVTPDVLIPRPETEHLVEAVVLWATQFHDERTLHIADIGTGSGAIAIALATHLAGATFTATDVSPRALAIARGNAGKHQCEDRIRFLEGDLFAGLSEDASFDAIASNPPYIPSADAAAMQPEVVAHEPHTALFAGADGLDIYRRLIPAAHAHLEPQGLLALEIGYGQRDAIATLLSGWQDIHFIDDYQGIPRIALALRSGVR